MATTSDFNNSFLPDDFGALLITTASELSIAAQVTTVVNTDKHEYRIPLLTDEVSTGWYDEEEEITLADVGVGEEVVVPKKTAGLSKISQELADDTTPAAQAAVGQSIARSIAGSIDQAWFGNGNGTGKTPKGLASFTDAQVSTIAAGTSWTNADPFIAGVFALQNLGANVSSFVANPADAEVLAKLKKGKDSNEPLLAPDASSPTRRTLAGVPLFTSNYAPVGQVQGIDASRTYTVLRKGATVEVDRSVFFTSDSVAIRGVARVGFGYPQPKAIVRIKLGS